MLYWSVPYAGITRIRFKGSLRSSEVLSLKTPPGFYSIVPRKLPCPQAAVKD